MSEFIVKDTERGTEREVASRSQAEEVADDMRGIVKQSGGNPECIEIIPPSKSDGGVDIVDHAEGETTENDEQPETESVAETEEALDQLGDSLETDPLSILPGHMIDNIQGQPAINKRGYAMIAERYGVSVEAFIESYPWENEEGRCVARAVATTEEGKEYQDYATASESDGDMPEQLVELASTRALKRVTGWSTGLGIVSYQELTNQLEEEL